MTNVEGKRISAAEAAAAIRAEQDGRMFECREAIEAACKQFRCRLAGVPWIDAEGRIKVDVKIIPE